MKLIIEDDEGRKTVVPLVREDVEITLGRQEGNTIRLTERNVSRRHAKLCRRNGGVSIEDLGSFNGIKVNGDRIQGLVQLKEGDLVQIGDYDLAIQGHEHKPAQVPTTQVDAPFPSEDSEGEEPPPASESSSGLSKKHESTSVIDGAQLKSSRPTRKLVDIPPEEAPRLQLTTTHLAGREYACIRSEIKIGRTDDNDIAIDHRSISRNHCKLVREDSGEWKAIDLQSANGVKINEEHYAEGVLKTGDILELGHLRFRFLAAGEEAPAVPTRVWAPSRSGSRLPLFLGLGVVLLGLGAGGWFFVLRPSHSHLNADGQDSPKPTNPGDPDHKPDESPPDKPDPGLVANGGGPKDIKPTATPEDKGSALVPNQADPMAAKALEDGKKRMAAGEYKKAVRAFAYAEKMGVKEVKELLGKARAESDAEDLFNEGQKRFNAKDLAVARQTLESIPPDSSFAAKAKPILALIKSGEEKRSKVEEAAKVKEDATKAKAAADAKSKAEEAMQQGLALFKEKKHKEAAAFFEKVVASDPGNAMAHMLLGTCYANTGRSDLGAAEYEEFVHLDPGSKHASRAIELLKDFFSKNPNKKPKYPLP
ncbi:MAG: FHA domain-containing protein [Deltaproteobacteria bacterium]|nr:FHA domain-containing protein [Deltaproteobacteria bacterium]